MKKDFFNGNIKNQFVSYVWTTIIIVAVIFFGCGGLFLYLSFSGNSDRATNILLLVLGVVSFLFGIWYSFGTIFVIRKYPKYKKITRWFLNSDYYFVDSASNEYLGNSRTLRGRMNKAAFDMVTHTAEQNKGLEGIKYPKTYGTFIALTIVGIFFLFFNLLSVCLALENLSVLPPIFQSEGVIFAMFIFLEVADMILSFVFAFRVKKIREITIAEYREEQRKNKKSDQQK